METPKYCQIEDVSAQLMVDIAEDFIPQVETWILAMENYVEKITHRIFVAPEEAYSKFYDGNNKNHILIDECISVDSLKIDGVEIDSESYYLMPYNKTPYWKIELKQGLYFNRFTAPNFTRKNIEISAKWAYSETCPPAITEAVAILVAGIAKSNTPNLNFVKQERIGEYSVAYDITSEKDFVRAQDILIQYTKVCV